MRRAEEEAALEARRRELEEVTALPDPDSILSRAGTRSLRLGIKAWRQEQAAERAEREAKAAMVCCWRGRMRFFDCILIAFGSGVPR